MSIIIVNDLMLLLTHGHLRNPGPGFNIFFFVAKYEYFIEQKDNYKANLLTRPLAQRLGDCWKNNK